MLLTLKFMKCQACAVTHFTVDRCCDSPCHSERHLVVIPRSSRSSDHSRCPGNLGALQVQDRDHLLRAFLFLFQGKSLTLLHAHADTENPSVKHTVILKQQNV